MDFDSPDVEKDFPGLYASTKGEDGRSKKSKEDSDYEEEEYDKISKKDLLIGRRKDKKDKGKDRGYAALEGESSPEEEPLDTKSPSKSKKSKTFKFTSSKSKEKREKSREKDKTDKDSSSTHKEEDKASKDNKDKAEKEKDKEKKKDKEAKKDKDKKDKKDKKLKQASTVSEEVLELGDVQPVFGVSVSLATERSRCHDGVDMPLIVRDCIDYLQEHGLQSEQLYKVEPVKTRLQYYKRMYNNRERQDAEEELATVMDVPTACGLLKLFMRELPEPVLTTDLIARFEEVASHPQVTQQQQEFKDLLELLPNCNRTLLCWLLMHFDAVIQNEESNKLNAQSLAMLLSPPLQMSHRLLVALLCHTSALFPHAKLDKYVPPLTATSPKLPESADDIQVELRKQESLLSQIHSEMNAGFISKKREEQLWEVQRLITQLKRKLRSFEKKQEKSIDESAITAKASISEADTTDAAAKLLSGNATVKMVKQIPKSNSDEESTKTESTTTADISLKAQQPMAPLPPVTKISPHMEAAAQGCHPEGLYVDEDTGYLMLPKAHADYTTLLRLQLENQELLAWKAQLQARIGAERAEILRLKQLYQQQVAIAGAKKKTFEEVANETEGVDYQRIIENFSKENTLLEQKKLLLAREIFEERRECIALQVELAMKDF